MTEGGVFVVANWSFEGSGVTSCFEEQLDLADGHLESRCELVGARLTPEFRKQRIPGPRHLVERFHHVDRKSDGSTVIGDGAADALPNPPRGVGRELQPTAILEPVDSLHEADVSLLNEIEERQTSPEVSLRDRDDKPQV